MRKLIDYLRAANPIFWSVVVGTLVASAIVLKILSGWG